MKNRIITNSFRTIKKSFSRFIPLFVMSFLGVFVFAGLQSIKPDMMTTLDNFLDEHNVYDLQVISTGGLTEDDVTALLQLEGVKDVEYSYSLDKIVKIEENDLVINISSLPQKVNSLKLLDGKFPKENNEIVVEENFIKKTSYKIGDSINIEDEKLKEKSYTIVGTVESGLYFNNDELGQDRGTTTIGSGTISYYTYILEDSFNQEYYNSIYITVDGAIDKPTAEEDYNDLIENIKNNVNQIKSTQETARYNSIYNKVENEIKKNDNEVNEEFAKAKKELDDAKKTLDSTKNYLDSTKKSFTTYKNELNNARKQLDNAKIEYNNALNNYGIKESEISSNIEKLNGSISQIKTLIEGIPKDSPQYTTYLNKLTELETNLNNLIVLKTTKETIEQNEKTYNDSINSYNYSYSKYEQGVSEYNKGLKEYEKAVNEYNIQKEDALNKIAEAKEELKKIEKPTWYVYDRTNHQTYLDYVDDTTSVNNLSKIFPIVFFAVAILVSLISMNRMVEDDRIEIGTLKSLGFSNKEIMLKYLMFSTIATLFGGLLGGFLGILTLPALIFSIYGMLFNVPNFYVGLNLSKIIISLVISLLCICGTTIFTVLKVVKEKPSLLMRPKAPKAGKRIILEKWNFLWKRINFSNKVTLRNLFRYKKRGLVTVIGIAGCSALMLCGFGIRDAIIDIANMQYKETFTYEAMVYVNDIEDKTNEIFNSDYIDDVIEIQNINVKKDTISANMFIVDKDESSKIVNLVDKEGNKLTIESGSVIITDKFADLTNLKVGDTLEVIDDNNRAYSYKISGIAKNYLMHYIYIDKDTFKDNNEYNSNVVYLNLNNITESAEEELSKKLMDREEVLNVSFIGELLESANNMLTSLNKVVVIIIVLSAALSFVVLYNLSNININERKREISTLKVLGFHDKEIDNYITKENIIFTIFGILLGLFAGYFLTKVVIMTVEIEKARFIYHISLNSYIYTAIITVIFTLIVNLVTHFNLKKIDMIASLKSVD